MTRKMSEGGYDAWGVRLPDGSVREFSTLIRANTFRRTMEGKDVIDRFGVMSTWTGLTVVHRFIPKWEDVDLP